MIISWEQIRQVVELFSEEHLMIKRFYSDFEDQLSTYSTLGEDFPVLYMTPVDGSIGYTQNRLSVRFYCFVRIIRDRINWNGIVSDTHRCLNDLYKFLQSPNVELIDTMNEAIILPINDSLMDYVAGWYMDVEISLDTYSDCFIMVDDVPVFNWSGSLEVKKYLTCDNLDECNTFTSSIVNLQEQVDKVLFSNYVYVASSDDLPDSVGGVRTLSPYTTYFFLGDIDLMGDRLVGGFNTCLLGPSSENAFITSTGLSAGVPLFYSEWTTPIRHITFRDVDLGFEFNGNINAPVALDWTGVNFNDVKNVGIINSCENFIFTKGSFLGSQNLLIMGTSGTIAFADSLLRGDGSTASIFNIDSSANILRRFRIIYSSIIAFGSTKGIFFSPTASIPTESYILDTINFSGGSTYLDGVDVGSNKTLFTNCVGINNTSVNGQMYMSDNATASIIATASTWIKVGGITLPSDDNEKYIHGVNRLTNDAIIKRKYLVQCNLSFNSGNNNICEFGFYDSDLGDIRQPSKTKATANASGRAENVSFSCVVNHSQGDYIEVWCKNNSAATNITVSDMNVIISQII